MVLKTPLPTHLTHIFGTQLNSCQSTPKRATNINNRVLLNQYRLRWGKRTTRQREKRQQRLPTFLIALQPSRRFSSSNGFLHTSSAPFFLAFQSTIAFQVLQWFYRPQAPFWLVDFRPPVFSRFCNCTYPNDPLLFGNYPTTWDYFRLLRISTDLKKIFLADRFLAAFLFCILSSVISP